MKKIIFNVLIFMGCFFLVSCSTPLDETIKAINQRYSDNNPMSESDVEVRFKEPLNERKISKTEHISIWVPNYDDLETLKNDVENGKEVEGVFVTFEEVTRSFQRLNKETLEMEWYDKTVIDAVYAEKRIVTLSDLK